MATTSAPDSGTLTPTLTDLLQTSLDDVINGTTPKPTRPPARPIPCMWIVYTEAYMVANWFMTTRYFPELAIGGVGFIMVMLVYAKKMARGSPYFYMGVLAVADMAYIAFINIYNGIQTRVYYVNWGHYGCGVLEWWLHSLQEFAVGVLVLMTVERMLVITFPFKVQQFFTVKKALVAVFSLLFIVFAMNCPFIWCMYSVPIRTGLHLCRSALSTAKAYNTLIHIKFWAFIVAPACTLFACNITIIAVMAKSVKMKTEMSGSGAGEKATSQLRHITAQTLAVSISFVVLSFLYIISNIPGSPFKFDTCNNMLVSHLVHQLGLFFYDLQHCLNAFLYCLSSAKFRIQLLEALHLRKSSKYAQSKTGSTALSSVSQTVTNGQPKA